MGQPSATSPAFGSTSFPDSARRWKYALLVLAAIIGLVDLWCLSTWQRSFDPRVRGTLLAGFDPAIQPEGWQSIAKLEAGSPLRAAGASVGDAVRFRHRGEAWLRRFGTDERIDLELRSNGVARALTLQPVPDSGFVASRVIPGYLSILLARLFSLLIGALLALRRPDSPAIRGLAVYLILSSANGWYSLPAGELREQGVVWLNPLLGDIAGMGGLWFALQVQGDGSFWKRQSARLPVILVLFALVATSLVRWSLQWRIGYDAWLWSAVPGLAWLSGFRGYITMWMVIDATTVVALWWSWRRATGEMRVRISWIAVALGVPMLWDALDGWVMQFVSSTYDAPLTWASLVNSYIFLGGTLILGWAILRHRVFDFGLVVQRALAYSITSVTILVVLGVGKWMTETLLEGPTGERNLFHNAVVAVAVVAVFAALQHRISKYVTRVFFGGWHKAAESLREFVNHAAGHTDADIVKQRFATAVDAFTQGQGCALYAADADGNLRLDLATLEGAPSHIRSDDEVAVKLAQGARRVDLSQFRDRLPADWAFPMSVRGSLYGVLVIGPRTEGVSYRPEELIQLADSARTIGLHLESLRTAELRRQHTELTQRLNELADANRSLAAENASLKGAAR
jgi:hypothetical protein